MYFAIIDTMENKIYYYNNQIERDFALDDIVRYREEIEIPYKIVNYNFGKVSVIR